MDMPHTSPLPAASNGNAAGAAGTSPVFAIASAQESRADAYARTGRCPSCSCGPAESRPAVSCGPAASDAPADAPPVCFHAGKCKAAGGTGDGAHGQARHETDLMKYLDVMEARMARQDREMEAFRAQREIDCLEIDVLRRRVLALEIGSMLFGNPDMAEFRSSLGLQRADAVRPASADVVRLPRTR